MIERFKNGVFTTARLASGYEVREAGAFLGKMVAALSAGGHLCC